MPIPNARGQILAGIAGTQSSVDGVLLPLLGGAQWLDDDTTVIGQSLDAKRLVAVKVSDLSESDIAPHGANKVVAGGGRWASFLEPESGAESEVDGALGSQPGAYLYAAGPDGTIAWKRVYQSGAGLTLSGPNGTVIDVPTANPRDVQVIDYAEAIWSEAPGVHGAIGRAIPRPAVLSQHVRLVTTPDGIDWLVVEGQNGGVVVHPDGETTGYVLVPAGQPAYNVEAALVHGELFVTWAVVNREIPADVRSVTVDRTQPRASLVPTVAPVTFTFTHPVLVCPFKDPDGATAAPAEIVVNQTGQTAHRPYIVAEDSLGGPFGGQRLGIYTEAVELSAAIALAAGLQTRVFACHDGPDAFPASTLAQLRPFDVPMLECYLVVGDTEASASFRWQDNINALMEAWKGDVGLIPMFYCGGGAPPNETFAIANVLGALRAFSKIVNETMRVKVIAPFAYLRANGITGHPELADAFSALLVEAARVGLATLLPVETAPAPVPPPPGPTPPPVPPPIDSSAAAYLLTRPR